MPGRYEALESVWHQVRSEAVRAIVCLADKDEIRVKSFEYAQALEVGTVPCSVLPFEIPEVVLRTGMPSGRLPATSRKLLQSGETVLIHCAGGVGRTAMLAIVCCSRSVNRQARRAAWSRGRGQRLKQRRRANSFRGAPCK